MLTRAVCYLAALAWFVAPQSAKASECLTNVSLTSYIGTSCSLGPLTLSNFQFLSSASPGIDPLPASLFTVGANAVTPYYPGTDADFLSFSGAFTLSNAGLTSGSRSVSFDITFDYQVVPANYGLDIVVISGSTGDDGIFVTEGLDLLSPCTAYQEGNSSSPCLPTSGATLSGTVTIQGYAEAFPGSFVDTAFVGDPSVNLFVTAAPEPSTLSTIGVPGLLMGCGGCIAASGAVIANHSAAAFQTKA